MANSYFLKILVFISSFFLFSCSHFQKNEKNTNINIVIHLHEKDSFYNISYKWIFSKMLLQNGNIKAELKNIEFNSNFEQINISQKDDLKKLTDLVNDNNIHIFFIKELKSNNKKEVLRGFFYFRERCKKIILISDKANRSTIAHEIGHFFGLEHSTDSLNTMSTKQRKKNSKFNEKQLKFMKRQIIKNKLFCY